MALLALCGDRRHERLDPEHVDHPLHIIGEHLQAHLRPHIFERFGEEVGGAHPGFESSEGVLDGLPPDRHRFGQVIEPCLHFVQDAFVLPAFNASDLISRALGLQRARQGVAPLNVENERQALLALSR